MAFKLNGVEIPNTGTISINGNEIKVINYNGTEVWKKYNPGVSATLSFTFPATNLMVWTYFNGTRFYVADDFGLKIYDIVDNFNYAYSSQGYNATYSGNTMYITSPQATGGDCNGQVLTVEYRSKFTGPADYTYTAALSGGQNAG